MKRVSIPALAILLAGGTTLALAQEPAPPSGPAGPAATEGETSDRTPTKETPTPLPQRDKTTDEPVGTPSEERGATSDRTPEAHGAEKGATTKMKKSYE